MRKVADYIRILEAAMVEKAKSGHPGGSMSGTDYVNTLYSKYIVYDPDDAKWFARDRFFLDPGHMSPMLYGVLAMCGKFSIEDLKNLRQWMFAEASRTVLVRSDRDMQWQLAQPSPSVL